MSMSSQAGEGEAAMEGDGGPDAGTSRTTAEWVTLGISAVVLLAVVGLVGYLYVSGGDHPPIIVVEARLDETRQDADAYYVPVEVRNRGDRTAGDVQVQAELDTGTGAPLTAEFTVTFLAGGEQVEGVVVFSEDPTQGTLTVEVTSYREP